MILVCQSLSEVKAEIECKLSRDNSSGTWFCNECNYSNHAKNTVEQHIECNHIVSTGFQCEFCDKVCPNRHALKMHKLRNKHNH